MLLPVGKLSALAPACPGISQIKSDGLVPGAWDRLCPGCLRSRFCLFSNEISNTQNRKVRRAVASPRVDGPACVGSSLSGYCPVTVLVRGRRWDGDLGHGL